ncbi:DUF11 domain-containing protein [Diaphorobacter sp. HDW4B]|uniref:DUF6923 family protein n=1 Tax=Diaphorobacter sp. HDW4B TaxID=2714925 RepID=UPI00140BFFDC|nr:DUF11 domain-containing protein [Diaphorobacter sp. HDW4B]QIL68919.1 DUF11 domain-containing protein [Diaphorobacter sp. HDW4B]
MSVRLAAVAFTLLSASFAASAQTCGDGDIYLSQESPQTKLRYSAGIVVDPVTQAESINFADRGVAVGQYNALGRNPTDGLLYAIANATGQLITVDPSSGLTSLVNTDGAITGLESATTTANYYAGGFDTNGVYYVKKQGMGDKIFAIDVKATPPAATLIQLPQQIIISDMAWVKDRLYTTDDNGQLYSIDVSTNPATLTPIGATDTTGGTFGAQFSGTNGLFGVSNIGAGFFQIDLATGKRTKLADAPTSTINDGASCPNVELLKIPPKEADLVVTKDDGITRYTPGTNVVYTITVTNKGPNTANGVTVSDPLPSGISTASWTCIAGPSAPTGTACTGSGTGAIADKAVNLPSSAGSTASVVYTLTMAVPVGFTGNLMNTAKADLPADMTDPTPADNSATDTDTPPQADLQVTKTDGVDRYTLGKDVVYTIVVTNIGPDAVTGATVSDPLPNGISVASWTCTAAGTGAACAASGSGPIQDTTVNLPSGGTATYKLTVTVPATFTGNLVNTVQTALPTGMTDPTPTNNSATDTDAPPQADLQITNTDGSPTYTPGKDVVYTVVVTNAGPDAVTGATVTNPLPAGATAGKWTCTAGAGTACTASGTGGIQDAAVNLQPGASVTYTFTVTVPDTVTGNLVSTAQTALPAGMTDPTPANNVAVDTDTPPTPVVTSTPVPVDSTWMLLALSGLVGVFSLARAKKRK